MKLTRYEQLELQNAMLLVALEDERIKRYEIILRHAQAEAEVYRNKLNTINQKINKKLQKVGLDISQVGIDANTGEITTLSPSILKAISQ
jgi:beta-galactosidase GanA